MDGGKGRIEKPLSFCLAKLYMVTRDVPTPNLRCHEIGQSKAKYRCLENIFLRFSSLFSANDGKLDWTLRIKLELRTFLYDICHYDI